MWGMVLPYLPLQLAWFQTFCSKKISSTKPFQKSSKPALHRKGCHTRKHSPRTSLHFTIECAQPFCSFLFLATYHHSAPGSLRHIPGTDGGCSRGMTAWQHPSLSAWRLPDSGVWQGQTFTTVRERKTCDCASHKTVFYHVFSLSFYCFKLTICIISHQT